MDNMHDYYILLLPLINITSKVINS